MHWLSGGGGASSHALGCVLEEWFLMKLIATYIR